MTIEQILEKYRQECLNPEVNIRERTKQAVIEIEHLQ